MDETREGGSSWKLAAGLEPTRIPPALRDLLDAGGSPGIAAHHILGGDGATLDPARARIAIDNATMACGSCGELFRVPPVELTLHGTADASSSVHLECPHCGSSIRLTGVEDPTVPKEQGHWIATAQLSAPRDGGRGWPELRTADLLVSEDEEEEEKEKEPPPIEAIAAPVPSPRAEEVTPKPRRAGLVLMLVAASLFVLGIGFAVMAARTEGMAPLIAAAVALVAAVVVGAILAVRMIENRTISILTILAAVALAAGTLVPATGAVMRCGSLGPGADLSTCDLSGKDLSGENLTGADLSEAMLTETNLRDARLSGARLGGADMQGADLTGAELGDATMRDADLTGATLARVEAAGADLAGLDLSGLDLTGARLEEADLTGAVLQEADLTGAVLDRAILDAAILTNADLSGASLQAASLFGTDLSEGILQGADLTGIEGEGFIADRADLQSALLREGVLVDASLRESLLGQADLTNAQLVGANLKGTEAEQTVFRGANLSSASLQYGDVKGAEFAGATLASTDLRGVSGLSDQMLASALGVGEKDLVAAVVANDLRFEGPSIISTALSGVPGGKGVAEARAYSASPAFHPVVVLRGGGGLASAVSQAPGEWAPPGLRFAELVAVDRTTDELIETCSYNIHPITRYQKVTHVSLYAAKSGKLVSERSFYGSLPRACNFTELVSTYRLDGGAANYKRDVVPWLERFVNPARGL